MWRGLGAMAGVLALIVVFGIATSKGGPGQFFDDAWHEFTKVSQDRDSDPTRIVSSNSGNRWVWWEEAAGAWSDKPFGGWGAGSFPVTHLIYRKVELEVQQPHSVPLQFLAETGVIGAALGMGAIGFLLFAALARVRGMRDGRERDIAVALFAGAVAWTVHSFVDFDWDIPGVTVPALLFLGVLAASPGRREGRARRLSRPTRRGGASIPPRSSRPRRRAARRPSGRGRRRSGSHASCSGSSSSRRCCRRGRIRRRPRRSRSPRRQTRTSCDRRRRGRRPARGWIRRPCARCSPPPTSPRTAGACSTRAATCSMPSSASPTACSRGGG